MIIESGSRYDFKHCVLWHVMTLMCAKGHRYVADPVKAAAWNSGIIPNVHECDQCQREFEVVWRQRKNIPDDYRKWEPV